MKIKPKKSLGQNFLKSKSIVGDIVRAAEIKENDVVVEVGPGKGILTESLLEKAKKVIAIEKDDRLIELLHEKFAKEIEEGRFELAHSDILTYELQVKNYKLVANIPYYLTGKLFRKFLESENQPSVMVLMVQKEVGERIMAVPKKKKSPGLSGKESILSISVKVFGVPKIVKNVPAKYFSPVPRVDSVVLKISGISKDFFDKNKIKDEDFFELVKKGFSRKRKMLRNNLDCSSDVFASCGVAETARAENLSIDDWGCLCKKIKRVN